MCGWAVKSRGGFYERGRFEVWISAGTHLEWKVSGCTSDALFAQPQRKQVEQITEQICWQCEHINPVGLDLNSCRLLKRSLQIYLSCFRQAKQAAFAVCERFTEFAGYLVKRAKSLLFVHASIPVFAPCYGYTSPLTFKFSKWLQQMRVRNRSNQTTREDATSLLCSGLTS